MQQYQTRPFATSDANTVHSVTFELSHRKCSVLLENGLDVTICDVLKDGEDVQEMIGWDENNQYKYTLSVSTGGEKLFFGSSFLKKTVGDLRKLENVKIPLYIELEERD